MSCNVRTHSYPCSKPVCSALSLDDQKTRGSLDSTPEREGHEPEEKKAGGWRDSLAMQIVIKILLNKIIIASVVGFVYSAIAFRSVHSPPPPL